MFQFSVSRSLEEAAKDVEWPGRPLKNLKQCKLDAFMKRANKLHGENTESRSETDSNHPKATECVSPSLRRT